MIHKKEFQASGQGDATSRNLRGQASSPSLEAYLALPPAQTQAIFLGVVDDLKYADTSRRGFLCMRFTVTEAKCTWHFVSTIKSHVYAVDASKPQTFSGLEGAAWTYSSEPPQQGP